MPDHPISTAALERGWTHSHEEDHDGLMVFRPAEGEFPPARGRTSFTLATGGVLATEGPGPDDRPTSGSGTWSLVGRSLDLLPYGASEQHYTVEEATADRLVLRPAIDG